MASGRDRQEITRRQLKEITRREVEEEWRRQLEELVVLRKEKKRLSAQLEAMKEEKETLETRTGQLEQQLQQRENKGAQLQTTIAELKTDKERLQNQAAELQKNVDKLRREKQSAENYATQLQAEKQSAENHATQLQAEKQSAENHATQLRAEKQSAENHATQLEKEMDSLRTEKSAIDNERRQLQQQLETSRTECRELEEMLEKTKDAQTKFQQESEARTADLRACLEEAGEERGELERELASRSSEFAAMMASKEKERGQAVKRAEAAERRLTAKQDKWRDRQAAWEKETSRLQSELETEMRLAEEFRRQLEKALQKDGKDFQRQLAEAMERVERRLEQVAEDLRLRHKQTEGEGFMDILPADVKQLCLTIQRLVGGQGQNFAQALLGDQVSWDWEDLQEGGWFMTSRKFWLCIKRWVEVSSQPQGALPLTSQHLRLACSQLKVDPTKVLEMAPEHEEALEDNFAYLMENLRVVEVMPYLRSSPHMTADAWSFLLEGQGDSQKVDRLLAVVYSMGEDGYRLLISALAASWNEHVLGIFPQDAAKEEALRKTGLPEYQETAPEPKARKNDDARSTDEGNDKDLTEDDDCTDEEIRGPAVGVLTKALEQMEDRMVARVRELVVSLGEVKAGVLEAGEVRAGLEAGGAAAATRETAGAVAALLQEELSRSQAALQSQVAAVEAGVRDLAGVVEGRVGHVAERVEHVKDVVHRCFDEFYKDARVTLDKPAK